MLQTQQYIVIIITLPSVVISLAQYSFASTFLLCTLTFMFKIYLHFCMLDAQQYIIIHVILYIIYNIDIYDVYYTYYFIQLFLILVKRKREKNM